MNEIDITKRHVGFLVSEEVFVKVMKQFAKEGDPYSVAMARALDKAVDGVRLTKKELDQVRKAISLHYEKRMQTRAENKNGIHGRVRNAKQ